MNSTIFSLLKEASLAKNPREQIRLIRLAIAEAKAKYPEIQAGLQVLDKNLDILSRGINWEAFNSYQAIGKWEFIGNDDNYFIFAHYLTRIDEIASEVLRLVEEAGKERMKDLIKDFKEVVMQ